ncbi:MAG: MFS transporter [Promethearchaeota archaeon]
MQENKIKSGNNGKRSNLFIEIITYILFGLGPLTGNVILVLFKVLSLEFGVPQNFILIAISSFMFPFAITQLFTGSLSDVKGRFKVILFGLAIFGIGMVIAALSPSFRIYLIANFLGGIGFGFVNPVLIALMTDITIAPNIPKKMGYLGAVANLGVGFGPILAGLMVFFGWRYLYLLFVIITFIGFFGLLVSKQPTQKFSQKLGIHVFIKHIFQEIRRPVVLLLIISAFLITQTYLTNITWTSRALNETIPENVLGFVIGSAGITGAIMGIIIGYIIKIKGIKYGIVLGLISLYFSLLAFLLISDITKPSVLLYTTIALIFTGAAGGTLIPSMMFYSQTLSKERTGALAGLATAGQFIGIALIPIIYNWVFVYGGIKMIYFIVLVNSVLLALVMLFLYRLAKK